MHNVRKMKGNFYTKNLVPGESVYGEPVRKLSGVEHRLWDQKRSKFAAYLKKGGKTFPFEAETLTLYLGAASGTTASHISDVSANGRIFAVEVSRIPFTKLLALAEKRQNIVPIHADANHPERYGPIVGVVDVLYQDIAQRDQVRYFLKNSGFLRDGGVGIIMIKARCIDVAMAPRKVFDICAGELSEGGLEVREIVELAPFEKDHAAIVLMK